MNISHDTSWESVESLVEGYSEKIKTLRLAVCSNHPKYTDFVEQITEDILGIFCELEAYNTSLCTIETNGVSHINEVISRTEKNFKKEFPDGIYIHQKLAKEYFPHLLSFIQLTKEILSIFSPELREPRIGNFIHPDIQYIQNHI